MVSNRRAKTGEHTGLDENRKNEVTFYLGMVNLVDNYRRIPEIYSRYSKKCVKIKKDANVGTASLPGFVATRVKIATEV